MDLSEKNRGFHAIFQPMQEGILVINAAARIVFANQAYLDFLGMRWEDIRGRLLREIRPGARLPDVLVTGRPILHAPGWKSRTRSTSSTCTPSRRTARSSAGFRL